ncbi:MAG TPA: outer membrane beta-barrel protein [Vicinamibacterales bacterium]|nr:outer membrane beta-barrel protein [Vicinamibacterales bacterium]
MTRLPRVFLIASVLLVAAPRAARADFFAVPFGGLKFGGSTSIVDLELAAGKKKLVLGIGALKIDDRVIGFEAEFGNIAGYFNNEAEAADDPLVMPGSYVNDLTGSVVLSLPPGATGGGLRPYVVVGAGLIHAESQDISKVLQVRRTVPAFNLGVGAIGMLTNSVGIRFDMRHLQSVTKDSPTGSVSRGISYSRFTIGLLLRL